MKIKLKKIIKALMAFFASYLVILELYWRIVEPTTYFNQELLKQWLDCYWWLAIYVSPIPIALPISIFTYRKANHRKFLDEFNYKTEQIIKKSRLKITGTGKTFEKREISISENQLKSGRSVLLTGEAGVGKSGVGIVLAIDAKENHTLILIIDARQLQHLQDEQSLRKFYGCEKPIEQEITDLGEEKRVRIVIDQLDNVAEKPIAKILIELAIECSKANGVEVIVISRKREAYERRLLTDLLQNDFVEIECRPLDEAEVLNELQSLGFGNPPAEIVAMCRNLLNLEILSDIKTKSPAFNFNDIEDEVTLWDAYLNTLVERESDQSSLEEAERTLREATKLAQDVLASDSQEFLLQKPLLPSQRRLESWEIVVPVEGSRYRFKHEKLQDYLYARYAAESGHLPSDVLREIGSVKSRNAFVWLSRIYIQQESPLQVQFLEALLDG